MHLENDTDLGFVCSRSLNNFPTKMLQTSAWAFNCLWLQTKGITIIIYICIVAQDYMQVIFMIEDRARIL